MRLRRSRRRTRLIPEKPALLEHDHLDTGAAEQVGRGQTGGAGSDSDNTARRFAWMNSGHVALL
jgi:hypothetical protein